MMSLGFFSGCASGWRVAGRIEGSYSKRYTISPPEGWMVIKQNSNILLTRHDPSLEAISVECRDIHDGFPATRLKLGAAMKPHEMAEIILSDIRGGMNVENLQVQQMDVVSICGIDAFKAVFACRSNHIDCKGVVYGFLQDSRYYELSFSAPERHYFDKYLPCFQGVLESFRLRKCNCEGNGR